MNQGNDRPQAKKSPFLTKKHLGVGNVRAFDATKCNGIELPFERGSMEDGNVMMVSSYGDTSGESQESMNNQAADEREANIKLDFGRLPERLKKQLDATEHRREAELLMTRVREHELSIEQLVTPKANASEKLAEIRNKVRQTTREMDEARQKLSDLTDQFDKVKKERLQKFSDCRDTIANSIDQIYKVHGREMSASSVNVSTVSLASDAI